MNCIVLVVDRLQAGYLGCYGNTWITTPAFNRLAAESAVFDAALVDGPELSQVYRALWQGRHVLTPAANESSAPRLPQSVVKAGGSFTLLTDDPLAGVTLPVASGIERIDVPVLRHSAAVDDMDQTHLARFFAQATDWLAAKSADPPSAPFCLWLHTQGLGTPWDARATTVRG